MTADKLLLHPLNQGTQHPLDFLDLFIQRLVQHRVNVSEISGKQKLIFQFAAGTHRDDQESPKICVTSSATSFGDVGWDRNSRTPHLTCYSVKLVARKITRDTVHLQNQLMALLPNEKIVKILHVLLHAV